MRNMAVRLRYEGTKYHGWQVQRDQISVAGELERVLSQLSGETVKVVGCGRTDAGVHAQRYCANFRWNSRIPADRLPLAANTLLPEDIAIMDAMDAPDDFNAILSCQKKEYTYRIYNSRLRDPFWQSRAWFYPQILDADIMHRAAQYFVGTHDFAAVRSVGTETKTTVRTIYYYDVSRRGDMITLKVCANGFLYNQVRAMTGTLVYCSLGKLAPEEIPQLLENGDRTATGPTAPPQGLYMTRLWYPDPVGTFMNKDLSNDINLQNVL